MESSSLKPPAAHNPPAKTMYKPKAYQKPIRTYLSYKPTFPYNHLTQPPRPLAPAPPPAIYPSTT